MLAALTDQESGNSTPCCSKLTLPSRQFVITTSRRSHVTWSYGCTPAVVLTRRIFNPLRLPLRAVRPLLLTVSVTAVLPPSAFAWPLLHVPCDLTPAFAHS